MFREGDKKRKEIDSSLFTIRPYEEVKAEERTKKTRNIVVFEKPCEKQTLKSIVSNKYIPKKTSKSKAPAGAFGSLQDVIYIPTGETFVDKQYHDINQISLVEIDVLSRLCHPNVLHAESKFVEIKNVPSHVSLADSLKFHLIMKKADMNLEQYLEKNKPLSTSRVITIMYQILSGVNFLHSQHYYHCDLKPDNILYFQNEDKFVVADFGLSAPVSSYETNRWCGTPLYTSPQAYTWIYNDISQAPPSQYASLYKSLTPILSQSVYKEALSQVQTDIFSLGAIFYELLTGTRLHHAPLHITSSSSVYDTLKSFDDEYKNIETHITNLQSSVPAPVLNVLRRMLKLAQYKSTDEANTRYRSVEDILEDPIFKEDSDRYKENVGTIWTTGLMPENDPCSKLFVIQDTKETFAFGDLLKMCFEDGIEAIARNCNRVTSIQGLPFMYVTYMYLLYRFLGQRLTYPTIQDLHCANAACAYAAIKTAALTALSFHDFKARLIGSKLQNIDGEMLIFNVLYLIMEMKGIMCVPSVYEYANSPLELVWFIEQAYEDPCTFLTADPRSLHELYQSTRQNYFDNPTIMFWRNRLLDVYHMECFVNPNDKSINCVIYIGSYDQWHKFRKMPGSNLVEFFTKN